MQIRRKETILYYKEQTSTQGNGMRYTFQNFQDKSRDKIRYFFTLQQIMGKLSLFLLMKILLLMGMVKKLRPMVQLITINFNWCLTHYN